MTQFSTLVGCHLVMSTFYLGADTPRSCRCAGAEKTDTVSMTACERTPLAIRRRRSATVHSEVEDAELSVVDGFLVMDRADDDLMAQCTKNARSPMSRSSRIRQPNMADFSPPPTAAPRRTERFFPADDDRETLTDGFLGLPANYVLLNIYNVSGLDSVRRMNALSTLRNHVFFGGVFHVGVQIYDYEWSYGATKNDCSGVTRCIPRSDKFHTYRATVCMGESRLDVDEVASLLLDMIDRWRGKDYSFVEHNCLDFANELCVKLGVGKIPRWADRFFPARTCVGSISRKLSRRSRCPADRANVSERSLEDEEEPLRTCRPRLPRWKSSPSVLCLR